MNPSYLLCTQVISVGRKAPPSALFVHANGGHRFPGCGQAEEPPGNEREVKFVTEQIWPLVSAIHLNPNLIFNVKYTLSPFLAFLNKLPSDTSECACVCVPRVCLCVSFVFHFHKPFLF